MENTESNNYFMNFERILEKLSDEDKMFDGAYIEINKQKRKELLSNAKIYLLHEAFKKDINLSELERILSTEINERLFKSYVKPLFYLFKN